MPEQTPREQFLAGLLDQMDEIKLPNGKTVWSWLDDEDVMWWWRGGESESFRTAIEAIDDAMKG